MAVVPPHSSALLQAPIALEAVAPLAVAVEEVVVVEAAVVAVAVSCLPPDPLFL